MKIFVDSGLLIEYEKQTKKDLLHVLLDSEHQVFINVITVSEYLYHLLGILGGRSPLSISESKKIAETLEAHATEDFLSVFQILPTPDDAIPLAIAMMKRHNLLPNDAMILASCKLQEVMILASYDSDFAAPCAAEGVILISSPTDFIST